MRFGAKQLKEVGVYWGKEDLGELFSFYPPGSGDGNQEFTFWFSNLKFNIWEESYERVLEMKEWSWGGKFDDREIYICDSLVYRLHLNCEGEWNPQGQM